MSIIKHVTLQKIVAHDFRYDPRMSSVKTSDVLAKIQIRNLPNRDPEHYLCSSELVVTKLVSRVAKHD